MILREILVSRSPCAHPFELVRQGPHHYIIRESTTFRQYSKQPLNISINFILKYALLIVPRRFGNKKNISEVTEKALRTVNECCVLDGEKPVSIVGILTKQSDLVVCVRKGCSREVS